MRGSGRAAALDVSRAFTDGEWALLRAVADGLEWSGGWTVEAAQRLRFVLDFCYCTGLRAGERVGWWAARWHSFGRTPLEVGGLTLPADLLNIEDAEVVLSRYNLKITTE